MSLYWIDTDPGVDDALAILLALLDVGTEVAGLSSVNGNVPEKVAAHNLMRLLYHYSMQGLVSTNWAASVVRGQAKPLLRQRLDITSVHGNDGLGDVNWEISSDWISAFLNERPKALNTLLVGPQPWKLLCLGPLTNIAHAVLADPTFVERVEQLVIMGGSIRAGGNTTMAAEFNFLADPEAASIVLEAGFPDVRLVPMDAALSVSFKTAELEILDKLQTPAAQAARELMENWRSRILERGIAIYDLIAWIAARHPEWCQWESVYVGVDTAGGLADGASLADWRKRSGKAPNVQVAMAVDEQKVWSYFFEMLGKVRKG